MEPEPMEPSDAQPWNSYEQIDHLFTYHPPHGDQIERYLKLREAAKAFAHCIVDCTPSCADQSAAIRKVREAVMTANAGIACYEVKE